jgi:sterol desaturase/sphingolipid hydroxylase (fatty acid hydroxylase superfamily)
MHHPKLFRWFHRVHHLSHNPTPWASYAFAPLEAVVQAGILPLAAIIMPLHPIAFAVFMGWQFIYNVAGHTGYELHPKWLMDTPLRFIVNTPTNHAMHHESMRGNYGIYFNIWDRLMGTNHADYEKRFREVTSRPRVQEVEANSAAGFAEPSTSKGMKSLCLFKSALALACLGNRGACSRALRYRGGREGFGLAGVARRIAHHEPDPLRDR